MNAIDLAENGWVPDSIIRFGIRRLLQQRLRQVGALDPTNATAELKDFANRLRQAPMVIAAEDANQQHYEVPAEFFQIVLGSQLKYSSGFWPDNAASLDAAEEAMLELTVERADVRDGQQILELGCGWGSLTLWMAKRFPKSQITAVSNSASQKAYIEDRCQQGDLRNVKVLTCDIAELELETQFDRILSVEMFEHVRNQEQLLTKISNWMLPESKLFVHIFCHRQAAYLFEEEGSSDWMTRHFFRGGIMPSEDLLAQFNQHLSIQRQWRINGNHYARTCEAWLNNLDRQRTSVKKLFSIANIPDIQIQRWRIFFMACAELFAYRQGMEWGVAHYLLTPVQIPAYSSASTA